VQPPSLALSSSCAQALFCCLVRCVLVFFFFSLELL
jgi:hypothetical protein